MSKLVWDQTGEHFYETGIKNGVLYPYATSDYGAGVAWNGLTGITESPSGAEETALYADDIKYLSLRSLEEFGVTIEAYTYPDEFGPCDGSAEAKTGVLIGQQTRKSFGMCYRTSLGNDTDGNDHGYKLHIVYGLTASPSERSYSTINDSPDAITFSWECKSIPVQVSGYKPTSIITIDSVAVNNPLKMGKLEALLYGVDAVAFDASKTYNVGDIVTYTESSTEKTYICKTKIETPAAWDAAKWDELASTDIGPKLPTPAQIMTLFN